MRTVGEELGVVLCDALVLAGGQARVSEIPCPWVVVCDVETGTVPNTLLAVFCDGSEVFTQVTK